MARREPPAPNALVEMLQADGEWDRILSGAGPTYDRPPPLPAGPPDVGLVIEPPPWHGQPAPPDNVEHSQPLPPGGPVADLKAPDTEEPPAPRIYVPSTPPPRPRIPAVDWRQPGASSWLSQEREP